ncbi:unnamed protein product [Spirodela intermedia]|uniref:Uncharacterized protein n=1 Tax=Spirodela intermedia TaxID=51605 RepID=A0A7I8J9Y7_SPIIN|nr:unnamed protein product [Spirodela intermedia]CAA6667038.1 unnamed protein product [Spirodela intermedia]
MTASLGSALSIPHHSPGKTHELSLPRNPSYCSCLASNNRLHPSRRSRLVSNGSILGRVGAVFRGNLSEAPSRRKTTSGAEAGSHGNNAQSFRDVSVDVDASSLIVRVQTSASLTTVFEAHLLYDKIKPSETIWFVDEEQLVVNLKKYDVDLQWPDIVETWGSLTAGVPKLLKGASIYIVGESTEINNDVAAVLADGIGYTPLSTGQLLEKYAQQSIDSWVNAEGEDSVAEAECAVIEGLSSHVRAVVATLGGQQGAARRADQWRHLYAGFTVWLSQTEASDEASAKDEARRHVQSGQWGYSNADLVIKFAGWEPGCGQPIAQASLSALKQLILSDKQLPEKKSLYIRLGCRGDWPNIKPPGWDPSSGADAPPVL